MMKRMISGLSAAAMLAAMLSGTGITASADETKGGSMRDISTAQIVREMGIGINLGNTFESVRTDLKPSAGAVAFERGWGSVELTEDIIKGYAAEGFESLRIPVAWSNMMIDDGTYTVSDEYLSRVQQVADWALEAGLYVIINEHWDGGWVNQIPTDENLERKYVRIWEQVAERFKDYGDHLIFESQNEEFGAWKDKNGKTILWGHWEGEKEADGKRKAYDWANKLNQEFVDTVRASGANNAERHLLISGIETDAGLTFDPLFKMPDDPAGRMAVSVHYYAPNDFALDYGQGGIRDTWGTMNDYSELYDYMDKLEENFVSKGIPVIIGECCNGARMAEKKPGEAREFMTAVCEAAYSRGCCPMLWDITYADNGDPKESPDNQIYNRRTLRMQDQDLKKALNDIVANDKQKTVISAPASVSKKYKDAVFSLSASANSGAKITYSSSNEDVAKVDASGNVTVGVSGKATIYMFAESTDKFTAACGSSEIEVSKLQDPPTSVSEYMTVDKGVKTNTEIKLPDGWRWVRSVALELDTPTKARALYEDTNYIKRSVDVMITRTDISKLTPAKVTMKKPAATVNSVTVKWNAADKAAGYQVYRYDTSAKKWTKIKTVGKGTLSYKDTKRSAGTVYKYKVRAYNKSADGSLTVYGEYSAEKKALTNPKATKITKKSAKSNSVKLTWKKVACTGYQVQKYDSAKKKWVTVKTISKAKTVSCTVSGLKSSKTYKFRVRAYKKSGTLKSNSAWSKTVSVKTK